MNKLAIKQLFLCLVTVTLFAQTDGLKQWDRGDIRLVCHSDDVAFGRRMCTTIREALPELKQLLRLDTSEKINLVVSSTQQEFDQLTQGQVPDWGVAAAQPDRNAIFLKSPRVMKAGEEYDEIVIHELSHLMVTWKAPGAIIPRWLDEGIALYASGELGLESTIVMARSAMTHQLLPLSQIDEVLTFRRNKANLAYRQSLAAVQYLIQNYGEDVISHLLRRLAETKNIRPALQSTLGIPYIVFEAEWLDAVETKYRWYALLDYRMISSVVFVMLFLLAFLSKKREAIRKKQEWEDEQESLEEE
jgi:hypothetical protein